MKSLLTVSVNIQEATKLVESVLGERAGADNCQVTIELPQAPTDVSGKDFSLDNPVPQSVLALLLSQPTQKIQQIKECRAVTGWGLKEAKDFVEHIHWKFFQGQAPIKY